MRIKKTGNDWLVKGLLLTFIGTLIILTILFVPPTNFFFVLGLILLIFIFLFLFCQLWLKNKFTSFLIALSLSSLLFLNYLVGFDPLNTILLFSFIIALNYLVK